MKKEEEGEKEGDEEVEVEEEEVEEEEEEMVVVLHRLNSLNIVLRRFQQYLSHITATAHIINGFISSILGWDSKLSCLRTLSRKFR